MASSPPSLEDRVAALERRVADLEAGAPARRARRPPRRRFDWASRLGDGEAWLSRLGIGLVLLGITLLFRYSVQEGWLTPGVRVGIGAGLGGVLLAAGWWARRRREALAQVLLGGGVAAFYATGFAAFQLYGFLPYALAFVTLAAVTGLAFALAVHERREALAIVAVVGGYATPFLLYNSEGNLPALVAYAVVVLLGALAIYVREGWRAVLTMTALGAWAVLTYAVVFLHVHPETVSRAAQLTLTLALPLSALAIYAVVLRQRLQAIAQDAPLVTLLAPVPLALLLSGTLPAPLLAWTWDLGRTGVGLFVLATAVPLALLVYRLRRRNLADVADAAAAPLGILVAVGLATLLDGAPRLLALSVLLLAFHTGARRRGVVPWKALGHALALVLAWRLAGRLWALDPTGLPLLGGDAPILGLALAAGAACAWFLRTPPARRAYLLPALLLTMAWLHRELVVLDGGQAFVTVGWSVLAVAVLVVGMVRDAPGWRLTGFAVVVVAVAKLLLIDLARLPALWRIALFLGLGGAFLLVSFVLPSLLRKEE